MSDARDAFSSLFAPVQGLPDLPPPSGPRWKVLLVDDEPDMRAVVRLALRDAHLEGRPLELLDATSAEQARAQLDAHPDVALILLDVVMESEHAGLDFVHHVRRERGNRLVRIVLVTGQPGRAPQRRVVTDYEIDGYRLKSELAGDGIFAVACTEIRAYRALVELDGHRRELGARVAERTADLQALHHRLLDTQFAMDHLGVGVEWIDASDGRILDVNRFAAAMHGYAVEEMRALRIDDLEAELRFDGFEAAARELRERGRAQFETVHRTRDGRLVPVEVAVHFLPADERAPARFVSLVTDITRRKEAERELLRAKEAAEAASAAKTAFLANMSHEIRTPLNAIAGMSWLIRQSPLTPDQADKLDRLDASWRRLLGIVGAVLDLARAEAGKLEVAEVPADPAGVVARVAQDVRDAAVAKGLALFVEAGTFAPGLLGDPERLAQALGTYANNAVKFSERGTITLRARIVEDAPESVLVRFEVADTGIGIAPDVLPRLFAAFEQGDNSTTRRYGGTGAGLALTRKLAQLMGGDAGASSAPGAGSTFWFTARLRRRSPRPAGEPGPPG